MEKRKFYNFGDAKGFTKAIFFQTVLAMANGDEVAEDMTALVAAAAEYELDGIANRATSTSTGEKKDPMQSEYALALAAAIVPLVTDTPQTAKALIEAATAAGSVSPKGTAWAAPWVSRVLNAHPDVTSARVVVDKTDAKGLKSQVEVTAYIRA